DHPAPRGADGTGGGVMLVGVGQFTQSRREYLAGLAYQGGAIHDACTIGESAGHPDADRIRAAEQRTGIGATGMALHQHLTLEAVAFGRVGAGVKQIRVAPEDLAVPEHHYAATLAGSAVLQADMDRIQSIFHAGASSRLPSRANFLMPKRSPQRQHSGITHTFCRAPIARSRCPAARG